MGSKATRGLRGGMGKPVFSEARRMMEEGRGRVGVRMQRGSGAAKKKLLPRKTPKINWREI
jgi:hypothetical protein